MRKISKSAVFTTAIILAGLSTPALGQSPQEEDVILNAFRQDVGGDQQEALKRYNLDAEARRLQERLRKDEPSTFAGMYATEEGGFKINVRFTGDAPATLAKYSQNPLLVALPAPLSLTALGERRATISKLLAAQGIGFGSSIDVASNKVRVVTRQRAAALAALAVDAASAGLVEIIEDDPAPAPVVDIVGGKQHVHESTSSTTRYYDRGSLGFSVSSGSTRGILTAAHFGRCVDGNGAAIPSCTVNAASFYNPTNRTTTSSGSPTLTFRSERLGGDYDVEWRTNTTDAFPNRIEYGASSTPMAITSTYDPYNFVPGSSKVCKQGFTTGYSCGTVTEFYTFTWYGSLGEYVVVRNDAGGVMAAGGDSGGAVFLQNTAVGLVSGVFTSSSTTRAGHMTFMPIQRISALGLTVNTQ